MIIVMNRHAHRYRQVYKYIDKETCHAEGMGFKSQARNTWHPDSDYRGKTDRTTPPNPCPNPTPEGQRHTIGN